MKRHRKKSEYINSNWMIEQDSFLIENSSMPIEGLINQLPFTEDEIINRKELLGLNKRQKQLRKFFKQLDA
ncbi:acyl-CoA thioesterase [Acinetobacter johnsonii]|uniref:Acyl-CoA thioesterase n=1 Tax=Acinetobacter johnsonii TaxID=40214 RepID=A0AA42XE80_ACIJO|nr:acyl-CoA thioesterase [Acinetobacter johnsonii]MDH0835778.1 acyl-CoA thioesterase [Acinetobacter johnsonii]MDH0839055.1 acyl-CoA thioesterase [Acinetobacter johnsonii]MDH2172686.1 acyl-CoA thioesterase [Acinetobacter johnsonii]MDH2175801.1 acyl-CoA thioesterase [Acinetobacter johnsonii]